MTNNCDITTLINVRKPQVKDGNLIHNLVTKCDPLDINSLYSYLLICTHFNQTSAIIELNNHIIGYTSAYITPNNNNTLFIWQVAVHPSMRGHGLASSMINDIIKRKELYDIKFIETTVTPSNKASKALFCKLANYLDAKIEKLKFFNKELFGKSGHEEELLIRIGPLNNLNSI